MVGATIKVQTKSQQGRVFKNLKALAQQEVLVGVTQPKAKRKEEHDWKVSTRRNTVIVDEATINNAELVYIHTNGSPLRGIPARPIIQPALQAPGNKEPIIVELKRAAQAFLAADVPLAKQHLNRAGLTAQNAVRGWFTDPRNNWAPNKPSTIAAKGSDRPLIDTGELRKAMTYVVREKR